jgi:hypothetical protein
MTLPKVGAAISPAVGLATDAAKLPTAKGTSVTNIRSSLSRRQTKATGLADASKATITAVSQVNPSLLLSGA